MIIILLFVKNYQEGQRAYMLRFYTAGESHGKGLLAVLDGLPAGINISSEHINYKLSRRQGGMAAAGG